MKFQFDLLKILMASILMLVLNANAVNVETCSVDLVLPKHLCLNNDDDDDNDVEDKGENPVTNENDLKVGNISIQVSNSFSGTVKVTFVSGGAKVGSKAWRDETKSATHPLTWTITDGMLETEPPAEFYLQGVEASNSKDDIELKAELTGSGDDGACSAEDSEKTTVYEIEVKKEVVDTSGATPSLKMEKIKIIELQTSEKVAVRTKLTAEIKPPVQDIKYNWTVGGDRVKTYEHDIDEPAKHKEIALTNADLQDTDEIKYFWKDEGNPIDVTVEATGGGVTCKSEIEFNVTHENDPNKDVYAQDGKVDPERRNPNGLNDIYEVLASHEAWHGGNVMANGDTPVYSTPAITAPGWGDVGMATTNYNGSAFLKWHRAFIDAHLKWRSTFNVAPMAGDPMGGAIPEYLKVAPAGAGATSPVYGYVRLGEFQTLDEVGRDTVNPWHNQGHGVLAASVEAIMGSFKSPNTKDDVFWRWHERVDLPRAAWQKDQAAVSSTTPATGAKINGAFPATIRIAFDKRVSVEPSTPNNNIELKASALVVDGSAATTVTDTNLGGTFFQVYDFSGFAAPTAKGMVNVILTGTASYSGATITIDYDPTP